MRSKFTWIATLVMALMINFSFAQEKTVTGTVSDATGPLPGATVINKSTKAGTQTDLDGKYSIKAKQGDVLEFSFVGDTNATVTVGASNTISTVLKTDNILEEVVVTGYGGGVKRSNLVGSVSVVTSDVIENKPIASFDQILQGSAPGLYVAAGSGQPGDAAKVRIRGTHSISGGSDPLYIMDGVPILAADFAALNPNDFESVSVLKDAASTSIYGSRGSSGVILITTKKGKFNSKTSFKYSTQYGITERGQSRLKMMNANQKMTYMNYLQPGSYSDADLQYSKTHSTDWLDVFFRTGITKTHDFSVTGGDERTRFYTGLSYYDQEGILLRSGLKRFTYRINLEHKVSDRARFGTNMSIGYAKSDYIDAEGGAFTNNAMLAAVMASPLTTPYKADGSYNSGPSTDTENLIGGNNLENLQRNINRNSDVKIVGNVFGEVEVFKNITARTDIGIDYADSRSESARRPSTFFGATPTRGTGGSYSQGNGFVAQINATNSLRYSKVFADKHDFSVSLFTEYVKIHQKTGNFTGYNTNEKLFGYPGSIIADAAGFPGVSGVDLERGLFSYFGTARYTYDERFSIDATVRRDASSRFSDKNKWGTFWAVGGSWNVMNEKFMATQNIANELTFRVSYGTTGNQSGIGDFQQQGTWGNAAYNGEGGIRPLTLGNPDLVWESAKKFNVGVDFSLFKSWISGSVDYYSELTSDLFITQNLIKAADQPAGIDVNAGEMTNKGIDVMLKAYLIKQKDFSWNINGNFNYNSNKITSLGQVSEYEEGTGIIKVGLPIGTHYVVGWAGVDPSNGQPLYLDGQGKVTTVYNEQNSLTNFGGSEPKYTGGFGTDFNYKGWSVSALFTFAAGNKLFNNSRFFFENSDSSWWQYNQSQEMLNIWRNPGDVTNIQSAAYAVEINSSKFIEDASFTRLRNVTLSYTFPGDVIDKSNFFTGLRIYVQGQNLYTWTNFKGFDPESDTNLQLLDYPTPRTITLGFDFKF